MRKIALAAAAAVMAVMSFAPAMAGNPNGNPNGNGNGGGQKPGTGTMPPSSKKGLCQAYFSGSETGREHKRNAPPFRDLAAKAEAADQTVAEYCGRA